MRLRAWPRLHACLSTGAVDDIGIVERAPNSSDDDSGDDDDIAEEEEEHDSGKLPPGAAKVRWSRREDLKTEYTENLRLVDRVFLLGDIVARANDQLGQTGIITGMRMYCDLRRADGTSLPRVPTPLLQPLAACRPGALVVHTQSHWLGRVDEVYDNVQIVFDDGSTCKVLRTGANTLQVHSPTMDEQTWFWPGMRVSASRDVLRRAKWAKGSFRSSYVGKEATVTRVQAAQALVRWLAAAPVWGSHGPVDDDVSIEPPVDMQRPSRLLELTQHHARSCWRLAEHACLLPDDAERLIAAADGEQEEGDGGGTGKKQRGKRKQAPVETCVEVVACHTRVDVVWQDGTRDVDGAATAYAPAKHVDGYYEFWPQDYVVGKATESGGTPPVGVVESVNHDQRLCVVTWRGADGKRELVPVYEIAPHPDFSFKVGDIVLRLPRTHDPAADAEANAAAGTTEAAPTAAVAAAAGAVVGAAGGGAEEGEDDEDDEESGGAGASAASSSLKAIGEVRAVGPLLEVRWMDGTIGSIEPEEAYVVNTEEDDDAGMEEDAGSYDEDEVADGAYYDDDIDGDAPAAPTSQRRAHRAEEGDEGGEGDDSSGWETVSEDENAQGEKAVAKRAAAQPAAAVDGTADGAQRGAVGLHLVGSTWKPAQSKAVTEAEAQLVDGVESMPPLASVAAACEASGPEGSKRAHGGEEAEGSKRAHGGEKAARGSGDTTAEGEEEDGEEAFNTADEQADEEGPATADHATPEATVAKAEAAAAAAAKAARVASAAELSAAEDRAACAAYAEHDQFWVVEDEAAWTWHHYYEQGSSSSGNSAAPTGPSAKVSLTQNSRALCGLSAGHCSDGLAFDACWRRRRRRSNGSFCKRGCRLASLSRLPTHGSTCCAR